MGAVCLLNHIRSVEVEGNIPTSHIGSTVGSVLDSDITLPTPRVL